MNDTLRLYRDMPHQLCQAEADEAVALHVAEMKSPADWTPHRVFQSRANVGVYANLARNPWRIRYGIGIAAMVVLYGMFEWAIQ